MILKHFANRQIKPTRNFAIGVFLVLFIVLIPFFIDSSNHVDEAATAYLDDAMEQAVIAFGVAKGLSAITSVAHSLHVGVGIISMTIGEALTPVNNLIEHYSSLMMWVIGSLVIQKLLLSIVSNAAFSYFLFVSSLVVIAAVYFKKSRNIISLSIKIFIFLFVLRFSVDAMVLLNNIFDQCFIRDDMQTHLTNIKNLSDKVQTENNFIASLESKESEINELNKKRENQVVFLQDAEKKEDQLQQEINTIEHELDINNSTSGLFKKHIFSVYNGTTNDKIKKLENIKKQKHSIEQTILDYKDDLSVYDKRITYLRNEIDGKSIGFVDSLGKQINSIKNTVSNIDLSKLSRELNDSIVDLMSLMALFLLKTILLPILFFVCFLKITKIF